MFTLAVGEGEDVVVDVGHGRIPPQEGSLRCDVEGRQLGGHVHR